MLKLTLKAIEQLLDAKLEPIGTQLNAIQEIVSSHTTVLDGIAKDTGDWRVEMTVMRDRLDKYETALKLLAGKLSLDLKNILH